MSITNPIHPLYGQSLLVRKVRQLQDYRSISLDHPDGGSLSLPASDTSLVTPPEMVVAQDHVRLFTPDRLLQLAEHSVVRITGDLNLDTSDTTQTVGTPDDEEDASRESIP